MSLIQEVAAGGTDPQGTSRRGRSLGLTIGAKFLRAIVTLLFVVLFNFFLFRMLPGDPIGLYARGRNQDAEQMLELRRLLNRPLWEQFINYMSNPFSSGIDSTRFSRPVWEMVGERVWPTVLLLGTAVVLAAIVGIWIGTRSGWKPGRRFDRVSTGTTLTLYAMPEFWLGMLFLMVFSVGAFGIPGVFPVGGIVSPGVDTSTPIGWLNVLWHMVLPCATLTLIYLADYALVGVTDWFLVIPFLPLAIVLATVLGPSLLNLIIVIGITSWAGTARLIRAQTLSIEGRPYLERAKALGAGNWFQMSRHVLPNVIPLVLANTTLTVAIAILSETTLSFLGLGDPMAPSWGAILDDAFSTGAVSRGAWWFVLPPGLCVIAVVLAFTLVGRAMERIVDPRGRD